MSRLDDALPPAQIGVLVQDTTKINPNWANWFKEIYRILGYANNHQGTWTPTYSGLTVGAGSVAHSGTYFKFRKIVHFSIDLTITGGNTSSVLGTTKITNFPFTIQQYGSFVVMNKTSKALVGYGVSPNGNTELFLPSWTVVSDNLSINGFVFVND